MMHTIFTNTFLIRNTSITDISFRYKQKLFLVSILHFLHVHTKLIVGPIVNKNKHLLTQISYRAR